MLTQEELDDLHPIINVQYNIVTKMTQKIEDIETAFSTNRDTAMEMSITPASIEIILRMYIMIRHFVENDDIVFMVGGNPKYRSMLLSSHSIACAANVGKVYLRQGNPLAVNYAEWLALIRYLIPSVKYWLFDRAELELKHLESINDDIWDQLLENSDKLLKKSKFENMEPIILGEVTSCYRSAKSEDMLASATWTR